MAKTAKVASKQKRISDIASMLEKGLERKEILQKLSKTCKVSARTLDEEIKQAKTILAERNKQKEDLRIEQVSTTLKEQLNEAIKSDLELEAHLCKIAFGEIDVEETNDNPQFGLSTFKRKPTPSEMTKAIDILFKKRGSNAPTKTAQTNVNGEDVPISVLKIQALPTKNKERNKESDIE